MPYKIIGHTADLRMAVKGNTAQRLFSGALAGMMNILKKDSRRLKGETNIRQVKIEAQDLTSLLVDFLNKALSYSYIHKEIYTDIFFKKFSDIYLEAEIKGISVEKFNEDIKAATYHEANVRQNKKGQWEADLIFDI